MKNCYSKFNHCNHRKPRINVITVYAFSMVELMITMVIVSTCLVLTIRVFSICGRTVSRASIEAGCINIFKEKIDALYLKSIQQDGVGMSVLSEEISVKDIPLTFMQSIKELEEQDKEGAVPEGEEEKIKQVDLLELECDISWGNPDRGNKMEINAIMPAKGIRHEYF